MARPCREREPTGAGSDWSADHRNTTLTPPGSPKHRGHMCPHKPSCISSTQSVLAGGMWNVWRAKTSERQSTTGRPQFDWTVERIVTEHVQWSSELKVTASDVFPPNWQLNILMIPLRLIMQWWLPAVTTLSLSSFSSLWSRYLQTPNYSSGSSSSSWCIILPLDSWF